MTEQAESLNVEQAAQLLGLSKSTIRKLVCCRLLSHYKLGTRTVFDRTELMAYRAARRVPTLDEKRAQVVEGATR